MTIEELSKLIESKKTPIVINKGVTPLSLLGVAFIVMKIAGYITWSWWWVLAPFWIPVCIALVFLILILCVIAVAIKKIPDTIEENITIKKENKKEDTSESEKNTKNTVNTKKTTKTKAENGKTKGKNG